MERARSSIDDAFDTHEAWEGERYDPEAERVARFVAYTSPYLFWVLIGLLSGATLFVS